MNQRNWQPLARSTLTLVLLANLGSACDSGDKQIGSLDSGGATETNDDGNNPGDGDDDDPDEGETGEACMGDAGECAAAQGVEIEFGGAFAVSDQPMICAANVEPMADGYRVVLTQCSDSEDQPQPDAEVFLVGDWPEPELADGDAPLTEVLFLTRDLDIDGYDATWAILRPVDHSRVSLIAFEGTEMFIAPSDIQPLSLALDNAGCAPDVDTCAGQDVGLESRIGFAVGYGCSQSIVVDDTRISDFGIEEDSGTAYHVLVGFAKKHQCEPDGDFHELLLGIVGVTP